MRRLLSLLAILPLTAAAQRPAPRPHPLPVVGASRERFEAVDAVTLGDRIFVAERTADGGWLRAYDASDIANPFEIRDAMAPVVGRPLAIGGDGNRVLVASVTTDTTRVRLTLFDVSRPERSRWTGAASLAIDFDRGGVGEMYVHGARGVVKMGNGPMIEVDLAQLEREFSHATRDVESSAAARAMRRALAMPGTVIGDDALVPYTVDTVYRAGQPEYWSSWDFALTGLLDARMDRRGTLVKLNNQWDIDLVDAATRRIVFTTHIDGKNVESITAPDSADVLVNDIVRAGQVAGRQLAVFNATIMGPTHRELAWEGAAILDLSQPASPRVAALERNSPKDTANLRYGWSSYVRDAVLTRDAVVLVGYDSTWVIRFDENARAIGTAPTGRFAGRLVPGPDGTVLELSVESPWRDTRRVARADTTAPGFRIRTATTRLAVRDAPSAIPVDESGRTTVAHRVRLELVSPSVTGDPTQLAIGAASSITVPLTRRGARLEARLPAGAALGRGAVAVSLDASGAKGRWIALAAPPVLVPQGATRGFVALDDPLTGGTIVVPDSGTDAATDAAFADARLRARLQRDSMATIFAVPSRAGTSVRVLRRDRGRAEVTTASSMRLGSYPASAATTSLAALRHLGRGSLIQLGFCLRDAIGKRVQQEYNIFPLDRVPTPTCADAATMRGWLAMHGDAIVEGPNAGVVVARRALPPPDTLVNAGDRHRWTSARAEFRADSAMTWGYFAALDREDRDSTRESAWQEGPVSGLTPAERNVVIAALAETALLTVQRSAGIDSTDSAVAVIRYNVLPMLLPGDSTTGAVLALTEDGSMVYGDWTEGRFVPRWETWSYSAQVAPNLIDLDGDGLDDFVFTTQGHDAKGHIVSQEVWAYDRAGRELTAQPWSLGWEWGASPISADVEDSEYCEADCGGVSIGRPGPDGTRPILTQEGSYVLRDRRYVFRPNPPKPAPKPKPAAKRPAKKSAPKKP